MLWAGYPASLRETQLPEWCFCQDVGKWIIDSDNLRTGGGWGRYVTGWLDCEFAFGLRRRYICCGDTDMQYAEKLVTAPQIAQLFRRWQYTGNCWKNGRCFHTKINQYTYEISSFSLLSLHVEKKISGSNSSQLLGNLVQKCLSSVANCWFDCIMFLKTCFFVLLLDCTLFKGKY